jgi:hypothetical protein
LRAAKASTQCSPEETFLPPAPKNLVKLSRLLKRRSSRRLMSGIGDPENRGDLLHCNSRGVDLPPGAWQTLFCQIRLKSDRRRHPNVD